MEDISNKTLALFLVAAIVVSVAGTLFVLNAAGPAGFKATGFATNTSTGNVSLSVETALSITLDDAIIDFGTCSLLAGTDTYVNSSGASTDYNNSVCTGPVGDLQGQDWVTTGYDNILVRNNGNVYADIKVLSSVNSTDFFTSPTEDGESYFRYWTEEGRVATPGCLGSLTATPAMFITTSAEYNACSNLSTGSNNNSFELYIDALIKPSVSGTSDTTTLTFKAYSAEV